MAATRHSSIRSARTFFRVPYITDILVTHMPPLYHLDMSGQGDRSLLKALWKVQPALHVFGHLHAGRGVDALAFDRLQSAYEEIQRCKGGRVRLFMVLFWFFVLVAWRPTKPKTRLVNAVAMGGHRDELLRDAIAIDT